VAGGRHLRAPDAWIFDLDGTLVDTVERRITSWLQALGERGIAADRRQVARFIGSDGRRLARLVAEADGLSPDDHRDETLDRRAGEIFSLLNVDAQLLPGVTELLQALDDHGCRWAIATSSRRQQVDASVHALQLAKRPLIVDGTHVKRAKPAPDLLLLAARELGIEPADGWYVGDATWDMQAAVAAGMPGIGVVSGSATASDLNDAGATLTVNQLIELIRFVQGATGTPVEGGTPRPS